MDLPAEGPSRPDLLVHQCRRERAGHVQQPHPDGARPASGDRRHHPFSCYATRSSTAYLYIRYEYPLAYERLQSALAECYAAGYLGKNILGSEFSLDIYLHRGAGAYICGEETGLIESLEGKRAWPRIKPPFPAIEGLFRKPTVVNNIETVACVTHIVDRGAEWFKSIGVPADPNNPRDAGSYGPKLYCLCGSHQQARLLRSAAGDHVPAADRRIWRRRLERPQRQGRDPRRHQHGPVDRGRVRHACSTSPGRARLAAWVWAPRQWW